MILPTDQENSTPLNLDDLIYTPIVLSTFGVTNEENNFEGAFGDSITGESAARSNGRPYNLHCVPRVQYSSVAITKIVDDNDEPTLSKSLHEPNLDQWLEVIRTKFDLITLNNT